MEETKLNHYPAFPCLKKRSFHETNRLAISGLDTVTDAAGLVLSVSIHSASPHEVGLVEQTLEQLFIAPLPQRLIGDRAYDSDPLDEKLKQRGVELIAPHRKNRVKKKTQDGQKAQTLQKKMESGALLCLAL